MTDLEITKACAQAMEYDVTGTHHGGLPVMVLGHGIYDPLHDDAQAMALVKKFDIIIEREVRNRKLFGVTIFSCRSHGKKAGALATVRDMPDLNRAICECVAQMQATAARPE